MLEQKFLSIPEMIELNARHRPRDVAWQDAHERVNWRRFGDAVNASANAWIGLGLKKGNTVAMLIDSSIWSWTHLFGVLRAGGVIAPLNTMLDPWALAAQMADACSTHLLVSPAYEELAAAALRDVGCNGARPVVCSDGGALVGSTDLTAAALAADTRPCRIILDPDNRATIIYSSGTTGTPKGIVHSHHSRAQMALIMGLVFQCSASSRLLLTTPPHTNGSFMVILPMLAVGGTIYLSGGFEPERYLDEIRDFRPTLAFMVPTMAQGLVNLPRATSTDWSCFDFVVTAGAPMPVDLKRRTRDMTGHRLGELWGFTEGVATVLQPHQMAEHPNTVGRPIPTCEIRVIDEEGRELPPGEIGELVGRSHITMTGYLARPQANQEIVWTAPDGKIFIRTGDLGAVDENGWITIKGRRKDMLISGGLNVYPSDIEAVVLQHETVADCTVVGVSHEKWGETPVAFVVSKPDQIVDPQALKSWINKRVGNFQRVHDVVPIEAFPRNTLGKVLKQQLIDFYNEAGSRRDAKSASSAARAI